VKLAVFNDYRLGVVEHDDTTIRDVTTLLPPALDSLPRQRVNWAIAQWDQLEPAIRAQHGGAEHAIEDITLRAANPAPGQLIGLPSNYRTHLGEIGAMTVTPPGKTARDIGFFLIAPSSVSGAGEAFEIPAESSRRFDHECEVAVIIGKGGRNITRDAALEHVFGYSALVDATMRIVPDTAPEDRSLRKSFGTFTPLGPWLVTRDDVTDFESIESSIDINGQRRQHAHMSDMIVPVAEAIEIVSSVLELSPGDVIASGTPGGVGPLEDGDTLVISIDRIGSMTIPVRARPQVSPRRW